MKPLNAMHSKDGYLALWLNHSLDAHIPYQTAWLLTQLPANVSGKVADDGPNTPTQVGDPDGVSTPGFGLA